MLRFTFSVWEVLRSLKFFSPPSPPPPPPSSYLVKRNVRLFGEFYKLMVGEHVCLKKMLIWEGKKLGKIIHMNQLVR